MIPAPNRCQLSAVPKQEQILLDHGQRAVNLRLTKVNGPSEAGPVTVNRMPPLPGRSGDGVRLRVIAITGPARARPECSCRIRLQPSFDRDHGQADFIAHFGAATSPACVGPDNVNHTGLGASCPPALAPIPGVTSLAG